MTEDASSSTNIAVKMSEEGNMDPKSAEGDDDQISQPDVPVQTPSRPMAPAAEAHFQMFMDPMFEELQTRVKEQEKILDEMTEKMDAERKIRVQNQVQAHIPQPLKGSGQDLSAVLKHVERLMLYEIDLEAEEAANKPVEEKEPELRFQNPWLKTEPEEPEPEQEEEEEVIDNRKPAQVRRLDEHGHAAVTSHSLAAYISCLKDEQLRKFTTKVTGDCQLWMSKMFRFDDASAFYHEEEREGLVRVCRLALYQKYPKYVSEGFEALYSRPPVIYISAAAQPGLSHHLCLQLGLPMSSICTVPVNTLFGSNSKMYPNKHERMDVEILDKLIDDDIAAAKTPVVLIAYAGTPTVGHVDDMEKIEELCKKHKIWLHVEGNNLATLGILRPPTSITGAKLCDSMTLTLSKWLGIPALPYVTLFKSSDPALTHAASLNTFNTTVKLSCLPLWVVLQGLGVEGFEKRITDSTDLACTLFEELEKFKCIKQISKEAKKDDKAIRSIGDLVSKALTALLVFEMVTPTVVFKYYENTTEEETTTAVAPYAVGSGIDAQDNDGESTKRDEYYDALNAWLSESLQSENLKVEVTTIAVEREGICIRFAPLESAQVLGTTKDDLDAFVKSLSENVAILDATVLNYEKFRLIVDDEENLRIVEVPKWAGLGAVQYIPNEYLDSVDSLSPQAVMEINNLNIELVHMLKSKDMAFSLGYMESEMACVKFGLITEATDIQELVDMVQTVGKEVQESSKYIESLSEIIKEGIEKANKDLEIENQNKLMQEGFLRQIPMIGSMMNWWAPPPENTVKGRTFNIVSGTIASTEETYKYKMQVQADMPKVPGLRTPRVSESGSSAGHPSPRPGQPSPRVSQSSTLPDQRSASPHSKSAGDVKAQLVTSVNDGDLSEGPESLPLGNGNLTLNLDSQDVEIEVKGDS